MFDVNESLDGICRRIAYTARIGAVDGIESDIACFAPAGSPRVLDLVLVGVDADQKRLM